jgi:hypothetical protein
MEELVIVLLRLLLQVVLYAFTGKWLRLGDSDDQSAPTAQPGEPRKRARTFPATTRVQPNREGPRAAREALRKALEARLRGVPSDAQAPWFSFPDEYVELEPEGEARGGEAASQPTFQRHEHVSAQLSALTVRGRPRSIASAVRDRQTLRYAVVLAAALGPRGTRR